MSPSEFLDWIAWARIRGPFGEERGDWRNGLLVATLINVATAMAGEKGKAKAADYMPWQDKPKPKPAKLAAFHKLQVQALEATFGVPEG